MIIKYLPIDFKIKFLEPAKVDANPLFILRSVMGKNLRSMSCISKQSTCAECMYNKTCVYAYIFETIISQNNDLLPGTDRASHPFSFSIKKQQKENPLLDYDFTITLYGKAIEYLPYIYAAFVRSGNDGLFKSRTKFKILDVCFNGKSILIDENKINTNFDAKEISFYDKDKICEERQILIELKSPLRFKVNGKYTKDFSAQAFMKCLYRRAKTLYTLYGICDNEFSKYEPSNDLTIIEKKIKWIDFNHYSARQKEVMELGGCIGNFKLIGNFSNFEIMLFELNKIANAGKNSNFGLGQIDYWIK